MMMFKELNGDPNGDRFETVNLASYYLGYN